MFGMLVCWCEFYKVGLNAIIPYMVIRPSYHPIIIIAWYEGYLISIQGKIPHILSIIDDLLS